VDLSNGEGIKEQFQKYLSDYRLILYGVLSPYKLIFIGNLLSAKKIVPTI
jgi:hypothetical protein